MPIAADVEAARRRVHAAAANGELDVDARYLEDDFICSIAPALVALARELAAPVGRWARSKVPAPLRWLVGWLVEDVARSAVVDAVENWRDETCGGES